MTEEVVTRFVGGLRVEGLVRAAIVPRATFTDT